MTIDAPSTRSGLSVERWFTRRGWADVVIATPYVWLLVFFMLPFLIVLAMSFGSASPTAPPFSFDGQYPLVNVAGYARLASDDLYIRACLTSVSTAALATVLCLLIGYPMALGLTRVSRAWRSVLLMLVILPFWTSFLLRVYAWMGLKGSNSWFNQPVTSAYNLLMPTDWALKSIPMMNSNFAVILVTVYSYLQFMILPLYANLEKLDRTLEKAAMDLGSRPFRVFLDVTLPLSLPGIIAGGLLVFIPASGELIIPSLVGDAASPMNGRVIAVEFSSARDWSMASVVAVALLVLLVVPMMANSYFETRAQAKKADQP